MNRAARLHILILLMVTLSGLATLCHSFGYAAIEDLIALEHDPNSCRATIILDTISNREWLNYSSGSYLGLTGPKYDCNATCKAGKYAGWTFASEQDVLELLRDAGMSPYGSEDSLIAGKFLTLFVGYGFLCFRGLCWRGLGGITRDLANPTEVLSIEIHQTWGIEPLTSTTSQTTIPFDRGYGTWFYRTSSRTPPEANFCASPTNGLAPLTVDFTDQSYQATSWLWDFGDGSTSTEQNPSHTYNASGNYTVSLTVTDAQSSSDTTVHADCIEVNDVGDPIADFSAVFNPSRFVPLTVQFIDKSINVITEWSWDFGDGSTSTEQNPSHTYNASGNYTVSLTVTGPQGSDTKTVTDYITVVTPDFYDAANSEVRANYCANTSVIYWSLPYYSSMQYSAEEAYDYAEDAYESASLALNENTSFWGIYAIQYIEAELSARAEALTYIDLAVQYDAAGDSEAAKYYSTYGFSINALADLYNGSAIWCCSMEASIEYTGLQGPFAGSPSFSSAASNGWLANMYFATSLAYAVYVLGDPSYYPLVQLYASKAYDYAEAAYNDASAALAAAGEDATFWGSYAVYYAASDLSYRSESLSYIDLAVEAYQAGDLGAAKDYLTDGYGIGQYADVDNGDLIRGASMESEGGTK